MRSNRKRTLRVRAAVAAALSLAAGFASAGALEVKVVDKEGNPVVNAVAVLMPAAGGAPRALPAQATIVQEKMRFTPAVTLVAPGAKVRFVNNDPWEHHVRTSAAGAAQFNAAAADGTELRLDGKPDGKPAKFADVAFDKPGAVLLGCHLHASMSGHVYVSESPWAMLTDAEGIARFDNAPDGAAQLKVWQADQLIDLPAQKLTLTAMPTKANVQLTVVPRRRRT